MVTSEANSRVIDSQCRAQTWLNCLTESIDIINKRYGSDLAVKLRYDQEEIREDESGVNDDGGR